MEKMSIVQKLKEIGYSNATAHYLAKYLYNENFGNDKNKYSTEEKKWAYEHGFTAEEVRAIGITDENYRDYLGDLDYFYLDPIDPMTKRLIDGKLVIPYTVGGRFPEYLPEYYCWIFSKDKIIMMNDNPIDNYDDLKDYINKLLTCKRELALKPFTGAGGAGFVRLSKKSDGIYANGALVQDLDGLLDSISDKYLVTEYFNQCKEFDRIWEKSAAALRVIAVNDNGKPSVFVSYARFGTNLSGGACNLSSGGIAVPFDWDTGKYHDNAIRYLHFCDDGNYKIERHPDSGYVFKGNAIPHFEKVKGLVNDICGFMTVHTYFGFDIMIGDEDVKICEINSCPAIDYEQLMFGGIWEQSKIVVDFFTELCSRRNRPRLDFIV